MNFVYCTGTELISTYGAMAASIEEIAEEKRMTTCNKVTGGKGIQIWMKDVWLCVGVGEGGHPDMATYQYVNITIIIS